MVRKIDSKKEFLLGHCNFIKYNNTKRTNKNKPLTNITKIIKHNYRLVSNLTTRDIFKTVFN